MGWGSGRLDFGSGFGAAMAYGPRVMRASGGESQ